MRVMPISDEQDIIQFAWEKLQLLKREDNAITIDAEVEALEDYAIEYGLSCPRWWNGCPGSDRRSKIEKFLDRKVK